MLLRLGIVFALSVTAACSTSYYPTGSYSAGPPATVWMVKHVSGGRQCSPRISYEPAVEELLAAKHITVLSHEVGSAPVCRACQCASYSVKHYLQVPAEQEKDMRELQ